MSSKPPANAAPDAGDDRSILSDLKSGGEQSVMPDLGGVNPSASKSKYKVHSQTLVIALVLAASGASLYTMRKQGMGSGIIFTKIKVDYDVDKKGRPANEAQEQRILSDLERSQSPPQALLEKIQKNPFQLDQQTVGGHASAPSIDPLALGKALREKELAERAELIRNAVTAIEVNSIMDGPVPLARINGKIAREGDAIGEFLTLKAIHDRSVDVEADGKVFTINMSENNSGKGRPPSPRR